MQTGPWGLIVLLCLLPPAAAQKAPVSSKVLSKEAIQAAPAPRSVPLAPSTIGATVMRSKQPPQRLDPGKINAAALEVGQLLIEKTGTTATARPSVAGKGPARFALPYKFSFVEANGTERRSELVAELLNDGLRRTSGSPAFTGGLLVTLEDLGDRRLTYDLPADMLAKVTISAHISSITPNWFLVEKVGVPQEVSMTWENPTEAVFKASLTSSFDADGFDLDVPVLRPGLVVDIEADAVQGFGLETARLSVSAPGAGGQTLSLSTSSGRVDDATLRLDADGRAQTTLRSGGLGEATVRASGGGLEAGTDTIRFRAPWPFLVAALVGGVAGAFVKRAQTAKRGRKQSLAAVLLTGAVTGLLVAVLYAVGVNVVPVSFGATSGEALVLGVAAVGAFVGLRVPAAEPAPGS